MKVLIIGSGGREHALALAVSKSPSISKLFVMPGNPGTKQVAENIQMDIKDKQAVLAFCKEESIELVIIGPEQPLVDGLGDYLRSNGIQVFGPDAAAAEIESSKSFSKYLMKKYGIPTADYVEFNNTQFNEAAEYVSKSRMPLVIKADGLAAGKGVLICGSETEALSALDEIFVKKEFGSAGNKIIIEEFMEGEEASIFAVTDGEKFICLPSAQDHKRIGNNDTGKNTGGMGAYSPAPIITGQLLEQIKAEIIAPILDAMLKEDRKFNGCLYCGLMITGTGPKVVEFNCRFGDPETQAVLPLVEGDLLKLFYSAASGSLDENAVTWGGGASVCVVAASNGYPESYKKGFEIKGIDTAIPGIIIYHAGTAEENGKIITNGGRVLGITSVVENYNLKDAKAKAYEALQNISFEGIYFRTDIADKGIKHI